MRVGFVTQLLWSRYGRFWVSLFNGIEAEPQFANIEQVTETVQDERLVQIPGLSFRLAAAQALALQGCDVIVAPELNPGETPARGGGQDPWIASFPDALASTLSGLPPIVSVPTTLQMDLQTELQPLVLERLLPLSRDPALVRRVWERTKGSVKPPRYPSPRWTRTPSETTTVGLLGQPWLLTDKLVETLKTEETHLVSQHQLEPEMLRAEGWRLESRLSATDAEVLGAARYLGRRGSVERLRLLVDKTSGSDTWLQTQVKRLVHKPLTVSYLQDVLTEEALSTLFAAP